MERDSRRFVLILVALALAVAVPVAFRAARDQLRPIPVEAVVVAAGADGLFRDGPRHFAADETVSIALAVRVERLFGGATWLVPGGRLSLGGLPAPAVAADDWPEDDRVLRVFWFTVECAVLGGDLDAATAARRLSYRTFLAPELGRGLRAEGLPEAHNDDIFAGPGGRLQDGGTLRLYARAELVARVEQVQPIAAVASLPPELLDHPSFPSLHRSLPPTPGLRPEVGELFLLPGFEPAGDDGAARDQVTVAALGRPFTTLVRQRRATSSWTLAAVALTGDPAFEEGLLTELGPLERRGARLERRGAALAWGRDVRPGDLLRSGRHFVVLLGDDGDGWLDLADSVLHSWRRPPQRTTLGTALGPDTAVVAHLRLPAPP